jgi:superfamily I DNA/RNA helicase
MEYERDALVCDLQRHFGGKRRVDSLIDAFTSYWARLQHHQPGFPTDPVEQQFQNQLEAWLRFHESLLVGEVVPLALDFIRRNPLHPDVPRFQYVLVDEYQDLNRAEQVLIDVLAANGDVTVIGDEDQSIYGFKYAHPEGIVEYANTHQHTHDELLIDCRRCPQTVVDMANALINHNVRLAPKQLVPLPQNVNGDVYIVQHRTVGDEIDALAAFIEWYLAAHPNVPAGEVLVLVNRRRIGNGIRDALNACAQQNNRQWTAQSFYFEDALSTVAAAEGFALLTLLVDREDRPALRCLLGEGRPDCRSAPYARLRTFCEQVGQSPRFVLQAASGGTIQLGAHTQPLIARFNQLEQRLAALANMTTQQVVDNLFPAGVNEVATVRQAALIVSPNVQDSRELLSELRTDIVQPELPGTQGPAIRIMSLHKSKGLTARVVVIAGCIAGILPTIDTSAPRAEQDRQMQEPRRLFYVGLTRSTETLVLSGAVTLPYGLAKQMNVPVIPAFRGHPRTQASPFLAELGAAAPATLDGNAWRAALGF